jgi:hypothetical protein
MSEVDEFWERVRRDLVARVNGAAFAMMCVDASDPLDVHFAAQLGLAIMLDKPLIIVVAPGTRLPLRLVRIAEEIVELDLTGPLVETSGSERLVAAIERVMSTRGAR